MRRWIASACLVSALAALPCAAATVQFTVREREGAPVRDQELVVHPPAAPGDRFGGLANRLQWTGATDAGGKVVFEGLPPGVYTVTFLSITNPSLIDPSVNPYALAPVFTLAKDSDRLALVIELWRGAPLQAQLLVDHGELPRASVILRSLDGLAQREVELGAGGSWSGLLVAGRWEAQFKFPAGYLLSDLVSNREPVRGAAARIDVTEDLRGWTLTGFLAARSRIVGRIVTDDSSCPVSIVANLLEPSADWFAAATARGGSEFQRVPDQFRIGCNYELWLPEGRWIVRPEGSLMVTSDPAQVDLAIGLGETRTVDFSITKKDGRGGQPLRVRVESPDHQRVIGAVVEIYRPDANPEGADPLATAKTQDFYPAGATFDGLAKGTYRVVAGHPDFLEAEAAVRDHDPGGKEPTSVTVVLREGASVRAHATDEKGASVREVEVRLDRLDEPPKSSLASEEIRDSKRFRLGTTDATGYSLMKGFPAGKYRIAGRMTGELSGTKFVRVRGGTDRTVDSLEVSLAEGSTIDVDLAVLPAASISGSLGCSDHGTLPPEASFRVFDSLAPPDPRKDEDLREGSVLAAESIKLGGKSLDRFRLGPLEPGDFLLAARPAGHEYWSWPPGLLMPEGSTAIHLEEKSTLDAGFVEIECGPVVMLAPAIASGEAPPDLRDGVLEVEASVAESAERRIGVPHRTEPYDDRFFVMGLPEGKVRVGARFRHPYLIPSERDIAPEDFDLLRGTLVRIELPFERVGGLIEVLGDGVAARRVSQEQTVVIRPAADGKVSFPGTRPGSYRIDSCADAACARIRKTWENVPVAAARTVTLR